MIIDEGQVLLYPGTGPSHDGGRAHKVVVVKVTGDDIWVVPICSARDVYDNTVILDQNTPIIQLTHRSYLSYAEAKKVPTKAVLDRLQKDDIRLMGQLPAEIYARVRDGIRVSEQTEPRVCNEIFPPVPRKIIKSD